MIQIQSIRDKQNKIVVLGEHPGIIQSILDFDYLSGKDEGSVVALVTGRRGFAKYFYGRREILIPTATGIHGFTDSLSHDSINYWFVNFLSGRRTLSSCLELLLPGGDSSTGDPSKARVGTPKAGGVSPLEPVFSGGVIFAEGVPELHSLQIIDANNGFTDSRIHGTPKLIVGPSSVGLLVPGVLKLGAIGGITPAQVEEGKLTESGHVAIVSGSGGMTNELINVAIQAGHRLSFALSYGGDRFPILSPSDAFLLAEADPKTHAVLYYGELGGEDEYDLVKLKEDGKFTKTVVAHIAGTVASLFPESPQFGHAKAKADKEKTTAIAKRETLRQVGFQVSNSFSEFISLVHKLSD